MAKICSIFHIFTIYDCLRNLGKVELGEGRKACGQISDLDNDILVGNRNTLTNPSFPIAGHIKR